MTKEVPEGATPTVTMVVGLRVGGERTRIEKNEIDTIVIPRFMQEIQGKGKKNVKRICHKLDISCRSWPFESLQYFFDRLKSVPYNNGSRPSLLLSHIKVLQMDDIIASLMTEEGLQCMDYISNVFTENSNALVEIDCSDNAIGTRGLERLQPLLRVGSLRRLYMNNCGLSAEVGTMLNDILYPVSNQLEVLHINRNQMGAQGCIELMPLLSNCTALQSFSYAGNRPLKEGTRAICQGLADMVTSHILKQTEAKHKTPPALSYLNLDDCQINSGENTSDDPVYILCSNVLNQCCSLTTLILRDCSLQAHGMQLVCSELLQSKVSLQYFDIGCNEIGKIGATILTNYIVNSPTKDSLQTLICDTNDLNNTSCIDLLCTNVLQSCSSIQYINIQCNDITNLSSLCCVAVPKCRYNQQPQKRKIVIDVHDNAELKLQHVRRIQPILEQQQYSIELLYDPEELDDDDEDEDEQDGDDDDEDDDNHNNDDESKELDTMMSKIHITS